MVLAAAPLHQGTIPADTAGEPFEPLPSDATIAIYRASELVQSYANVATDTERGQLLRTALADAVAGDVVSLGAFTFDMGGLEHLEFPSDVTVRGSGKNFTRITSSCPQSVDPASTFELNDGTVVEDLWLEGSLKNGLYQPLVGTQLAHTEDTTTFLRRLKITGDSDGLFVWGSSTYRYEIFAYDCEISTGFDAVAVLGSGLNKTLVELYNCSLTVTQPSGIPTHVSNAVNARSGTVGLYNCTVTAQGDNSSIQTAGVWTVNHASAIVSNTTFDVSSPSGWAHDLIIQNGFTITVIGGSGSGPGGAYTLSNNLAIFAPPVPSTIQGRHLFYNNSGYDGGDAESNHLDAEAIATDKAPLLPATGQATSSNVTSYSQGINGIAIDLAGTNGSVTADDFTFKVGNDNSPAAWTTPPAPKSVTVWNKWGAGGSDRVVLIWEDATIINQWLEVTMLANLDTGLAAPDTFYFGSAVGDSGSGNTSLMAIVNVTDMLSARNHPASLFANIPLTNRYDFNRDGRVDTTDELLARNNFSTSSSALRFIEIAATAEILAADTQPAAPAADWAMPDHRMAWRDAEWHAARLLPAAVDVALNETVEEFVPPRAARYSILGLQSFSRRGRLV